MGSLGYEQVAGVVAVDVALDQWWDVEEVDGAAGFACFEVGKEERTQAVLVDCGAGAQPHADHRGW